MKTIKKIVALATGATMLGATMMGAMAADLGNYPAPFVEGCSFSGALVIGEDADPSDVAGAVDIASSLAISGETTTTGTGTEVTVDGEAVKLEKSSDKLNLGENLSTLQSTKIDNDDLPTVLVNGEYSNGENKEFDYEQEIEMGDQTFEAFKDRSYNDDEPTIGVHVEATSTLMTYSLTFTTDAESDLVDSDGNEGGKYLEDMEDTTIEILGNVYDIVEATNESGGYFELMGGATKDVMEQGETKTFTLNDKEYEVEVTYIGTTSGTSKVKFKVNGEVTDALAVDDTYETDDGTQLGIREILEEEAGEVTADQVEFYIGAEKMTLENGKDLVLGKDDVDDVDVTIDGTTSGTEYTLTSIDLAWKPEDEIFITEEQVQKLPGLESIKISYEGMTQPAEETIAIADSDDDTIELTVPIEDSGDDGFTFDLVFDAGSGFNRLGNSDYELLADTDASNDYNFSYDDNNYFIVSNTNSYETHFVEATGFDDEDGVDFEDAVTGSEKLKKGRGESFDFGDITLNVQEFNATNKWVVVNTTSANFDGDVIYTEEGMKITLPAVTANQTTYNLTFEEEADDSGVTGSSFTVTLEGNQSNSVDADVKTTNLTSIGEIGDSDEYVHYVQTGEVGTKLVIDKGPDQHTAEITYPGGESYGNVYVSESETGFGVSESSGTAVCKVTVPKAKMDSEITDVGAQNLIVVGGPCANTVAAEVMGVASTVPECLEGFEEGKAMIKMYEQTSGKVAMVVAGYSALDTRKATDVLYDYGDYDLSGDEVEVVGTTRSDISVSAATSE